MPSKHPEEKALFIGRIPLDVTPSELRERFTRYGEIKRCEVKRGGYGFVEFYDPSEADRALEEHGTSFFGERITVQYAKTRKAEPGSDGCFRCGDLGHWSRNCPMKYTDSRNDRSTSRHRSRRFPSSSSYSTREYRPRSRSRSRDRVRDRDRTHTYRTSHSSSYRSKSHRYRSYSRSRSPPFAPFPPPSSSSKSRPLSRSPSRSRSRYTSQKASSRGRRYSMSRSRSPSSSRSRSRSHHHPRASSSSSYRSHSRSFSHSHSRSRSRSRSHSRSSSLQRKPNQHFRFRSTQSVSSPTLVSPSMPLSPSPNLVPTHDSSSSFSPDSKSKLTSHSYRSSNGSSSSSSSSSSSPLPSHPTSSHLYHSTTPLPPPPLVPLNDTLDNHVYEHRVQASLVRSLHSSDPSSSSSNSSLQTMHRELELNQNGTHSITEPHDNDDVNDENNEDAMISSPGPVSVTSIAATIDSSSTMYLPSDTASSSPFPEFSSSIASTTSSFTMDPSMALISDTNVSESNFSSPTKKKKSSTRSTSSTQSRRSTRLSSSSSSSSSSSTTTTTEVTELPSSTIHDPTSLPFIQDKPMDPESHGMDANETPTESGMMMTEALHTPTKSKRSKRVSNSNSTSTPIRRNTRRSGRSTLSHSTDASDSLVVNEEKGIEKSFTDASHSHEPNDPGQDEDVCMD